MKFKFHASVFNGIYRRIHRIRRRIGRHDEHVVNAVEVQGTSTHSRVVRRARAGRACMAIIAAAGGRLASGRAGRGGTTRPRRNGRCRFKINEKPMRMNTKLMKVNENRIQINEKAIQNRWNIDRTSIQISPKALPKALLGGFGGHIGPR